MPPIRKGRSRGVYCVTDKKGVSYGIDLTDSEGRHVRRIVGEDLQAALLELQAVRHSTCGFIRPPLGPEGGGPISNTV